MALGDCSTHRYRCWWFHVLKTQTPPEPIKVYKVVTPTSKPAPPIEADAEKMATAAQHEHDHNHGHSHETVPHSHTEEISSGSSGSDWRDDSAFESSSPKVDPWKQTYPEQEVTDATDDTYPPRDWYKTEDPELRAEYLYAQLLKQFGDTPEVQAIGDYELKVARGISPTL